MRNPTQLDVASAAGVSRGLVSLALAGSPLVAEGTRQRIEAEARRLGYTRNLGAAALATRTSSVLGVVLPDLRNPFFEGVVEALQEEATTRGLLPMMATASDDRDREAGILRGFLELRAVGAVVVSPVQGIGALDEVGRAMPLVLVGADAPGETVDTVHVDEDAAARLVVEHAHARGWDSVVFLPERSGPGAVWVARRERALAGAARDAGMAFRSADRPGGAPLGEALVHELRSGAVPRREGSPSRPAMVAHNNLIAIDVVSAARSAGLVPGQDLGVIAYDETHLARRPEFSVTTLSQDTERLAALAVSALLDRRDPGGGPVVRAGGAGGTDGTPPLPGREQVVDPFLVVRSSS